MPSRPLTPDQIETAVDELVRVYENHGELDTGSGVEALLALGIEGAVVQTSTGSATIHPKVREAFTARLGAKIIWDRDERVWRRRRKSDPPWKAPKGAMPE